MLSLYIIKKTLTNSRNSEGGTVNSLFSLCRKVKYRENLSLEKLKSNDHLRGLMCEYLYKTRQK